MSRIGKHIYTLIINAALMLGGLLACLIVLEAGLRIWDGVPVFTTVNFVGQELNQIHGAKNPKAAFDSQVGWVQRPGVSDPDFTTGDFGVRMPSRNVVPLKQGGILMVGDSFGTGSEVLDNESWPAQLEAALGKQVINAGVGGYGLDQIVLRAEQLIPLLKPQILLVETRLGFANAVNRMSVYGGAPKPYYEPVNGKLVLHNNPVPRVVTDHKDIGWLRSVFGHSYLVQYVMTRLDLLQWWVAAGLGNKVVLSNDESIEVNCLLLRRIGELRDQYKMKTLLVFQYGAVEAMDAQFSWPKDREKVLSCAKDQRLPVVDGLEMLQSAYREQGLSNYQKLWVMHDHDRVYGHMSSKGNSLIAKFVEKSMRDILAEAHKP